MKPAIELVASFIDPNPIVYCRLATVNKQFYSVFTSDRLWSRLDVYSKKTNIFKDFLERLPTFERIMHACWYGLYFKNGFNVETIDNIYVHLGYYARGTTRVGLYLCRDNGLDDDTTVLSSDPVFLDLLFTLNPDRIKNISHKFRDNREFIWNLCLKHPSVLLYTDTIRQDANFLCRLVDFHVSRGHPVDFISHDSPLEAIEHAIKVIPKGMLLSHYFMISRKEQFKQMITTHRALLAYITGNPHFLDTFPEYCDRETCLAALEYNPRVQEWWLRYTNFLENQDKKVVATALQNYPILIHGVKDPSRDDILHALEQGQNVSELCDSNDPDLMAICLDKMYCEPPENLRDNLDWMKQRVSANPASWKYASDHLKQNRDLLLLAINSENNSRPNLPGHSWYDDTELPECFWHDTELIQRLTTIPEMVPKHLQTKEMVHILVDKGRFNEAGYPYDLVKAAVLYNVTQIRECRENACTLAKDPSMKEFIQENIYDIDWECQWGGLDFVFGERPDWNEIDRQSALCLFGRDPDRYQQLTSKWIDTDFVVDVVKANGKVFGYLDHKFKNNKTIQMAIGPLRSHESSQKQTHVLGRLQ